MAVGPPSRARGPDLRVPNPLRSVRKGGFPTAVNASAFDARSLLLPVTMQATTRSLDFARDDSGWGGLKLRGQNTHSNFAKGAKLEWGTRRCRALLGLDGSETRPYTAGGGCQ
jgi:hypothetical protein